MRFKLYIECDNDAFHDVNGDPYPWPEVARILRKAAARVEAQDLPGMLMDANGNSVGEAVFTDAPRRDHLSRGRSR